MDPYGPGSVPQRRAREDDSYDVDVKRRRTDRSPVDPIRGRELINTREARASNSSNFTPVDSMELSRSRKRQPLPPQSARFREASKKPAPPEPIAPVPGTQYSGVRNQPPHSTRDPPTGPSGRGRNRVDSGIVQAREIDVMELDHLPLSRPPPARIASSVAADKGIGSPSMPPTGPRAMSKISGQPHPLTPPSATQELSWQRPPPPHLRQDIYSAIAGDQQDIPSRSARHSRKVTGSNSTPLGENRRQPPEPPRLDIPTAPVADRYRQLPTPTHLEVERNRYVDDYSKTVSDF
ncbi:hypothetical protein BDY19DRAFT_161006 [Irpex rosettiformis]|uniref:Uncharacterized protein n=1 Tax=Irpex rosettiformis TaxID=378272 RepID=A0ACB8U4H1_9APHY|nr:hypothetical protein BDY19DRAFT_161006 [Irpex rosettiformis]